MRPFECGQCRNTVFFDNDVCLSCGAVLGFVAADLQMRAFAPPAGQPGEPGEGPWPGIGGGPALRPCGNRHSAAHCNWMLDDGDTPGQTLCCSCRLTQVLPSLDNPRNGLRWQRIEQAKRRLVFTLLSLGLAPEPKQGPDDPLGLAYRLLDAEPGAPEIRTGHENGVIVINVAEADDDHREAQRVRLGEPQRTLLGHLRHETAHYLQYRWIAGTAAMPGCREHFGDEIADYAQALAHHYAKGPPADWSQHFISPYASAHPWEDWAETCAHYLLVVDAVQTAASWGLQLSGHLSATPHDTDLKAPSDVQHLVLEQWLPVAQFLNAMNRSLGLLDSYPFQIPAAVLDKLATVQQLLRGAAGLRQRPLQRQVP